LNLTPSVPSSFNDPTVYWGSYARVAGRSLLFVFNKPVVTAAYVYIGFSANPWGTPTAVGFIALASWHFNSVATVTVGPALSNGVDQEMGIILRSVGSFSICKSNGTLLWVENISAINPVCPGVLPYDGSGVLDNIRLVDLPAPWNSDFGIATQRLAGARLVGDTFIHEADCLIEYMVTTLPVDSIWMMFRYVDADNTWVVVVQVDGSMLLYERVAAVNTLRGSGAAGSVANGQRVVIVADGQTIKVYANNVLKITYTNAVNFVTSISGKLFYVGAGGAVSDIVSWPHTLSGAALAAITDALAGTPAPLLLDEFITPNPFWASPGNAEPGPGVRTVIDTESKVSIVNGKLNLSKATVSDFNNPVTYWNPVSRVMGRIFRLVIQKSGTGLIYVGMDDNAVGAPTVGGFVLGSLLNVLITGAISVTIGIPVSVDTDYDLSFVIRSPGVFFIAKVGTDFKILWVDASINTASIYFGVNAYADTLKMDDFRVTDLPAPWNTNFGVATQRLAGARALNDEYVHEANCLIEYVVTLAGAGNVGVSFRFQDLLNRWYVSIQPDGTMTLYERVADIPVSRGVAGAGTVVSGHRIVIVADGTTIKIYSNNVLRITYAAAVNFQNETAGRVSGLPAGGGISDLISWPIIISGAALSALVKV
jgi:hypothetical protein